MPKSRAPLNNSAPGKTAIKAFEFCGWKYIVLEDLRSEHHLITTTRPKTVQLSLPLFDGPLLCAP